MEWKVFHFGNDTEITVNARVITHFNAYVTEGDQVRGTEIYFMSGTTIKVKEEYEDVVNILKGE